MGLFLPRQEILVPIGLVTQPNQYKQYPPGACGVARNVVMRNAGELVQAPDVQDVQSVAFANYVMHKLLPLDSGHAYSIHANGTTWSIYDTASSANYPGSATNTFSATGRISAARVAERLIVNGSFGNMVGDYMAPANGTERALREAGLPQPTFSAFGTEDDGEGWLADNQMVSYCACFVRTFADGYELRSAPSPAMKIWIDPLGGGTRPVNIGGTVRWPLNPLTTILAGDKIEIYRTDTLDTTNSQADPGDTFKRVQVYEITATDIASTLAGISDSQPCLPGTNVCPGEELYSNPGQEGSTYRNRRPPIAKCISSYKGFAFYGHTTEKAQFVFSVPGGVGDASHITSAIGVSPETFRRAGIGIRGGAGSKTSGSPTITGVSAANMVGIVPGQRWWGGPGFTANVDRVLSVTASTITMSANSSTTDAAGWTLQDVIEIDGVIIMMDSIYALSYAAMGQYEVTCNVSIPAIGEEFLLAFEFTMEPNAAPLNANITARATNGQNYSPPLPTISQTVKTFTPLTTKNRSQWSKEQQPEHCPSVSENWSGFGELYATVETRDALWHWCSDGLYRLSGDAGALGLGNFESNCVSSTLILAAPQAACALNEFQYAYTNIGFVEVDSAGNIINLSEGVIGDLLPGQKYVESRGIIVERNETDDEVVIVLGDNGVGSSNTVYVFNTKQRAWTSLSGNGANLSNITALAMQRSPASGQPRLLFGVSPLSGGIPRYSGWNSLSAFLAWETQPRPIYGDDPLEVKNWMWCDYLFSASSAGRNVTPIFNNVPFSGVVDIEALDVAAYARAGVPDEYRAAQSITPGVKGDASATQCRFQGYSMALKQLTNQSKKR